VGAEWARLHGLGHRAASALAGSDHIAVIIEEAFSPAEQRLARQTPGQNVMQTYTEQMLAQLYEAVTPRVEAHHGRHVVGASYSLNFTAGWVVCVFKLGEAL
jgi:uncharacterized protein YbcI